MTDYFSSKTSASPQESASNLFQSRLRAILVANEQTAEVLAYVGRSGCTRQVTSREELRSMLDRCEEAFSKLVNIYRRELSLDALPPRLVLDALAVRDWAATFLSPNESKEDLDAPPPPPPPPVQNPAFVIFFNFLSSETSTQAFGAVKQAAEAFKGNNFSYIIITGHTDTAEAADVDGIALSLWRATAVRDVLAQYGVPATAMYMGTRGSAFPLVATGAQVREPQNRRVEVVLMR